MVGEDGDGLAGAIEGQDRTAVVRLVHDQGSGNREDEFKSDVNCERSSLAGWGSGMAPLGVPKVAQL